MNWGRLKRILEQFPELRERSSLSDFKRINEIHIKLVPLYFPGLGRHAQDTNMSTLRRPKGYALEKVPIVGISLVFFLHYFQHPSLPFTIVKLQVEGKIPLLLWNLYNLLSNKCMK